MSKRWLPSAIAPVAGVTRTAVTSRSELAAKYPGKETVWLVPWRDFVPAGYP